MVRHDHALASEKTACGGVGVGVGVGLGVGVGVGAGAGVGVGVGLGLGGAGHLGLDAAVERGREFERVGVVEQHAVLLEVLLQAGESSRSGRRVTAKHRKLREGARDLARHRDVGEQHELLHLVAGQG